MRVFSVALCALFIANSLASDVKGFNDFTLENICSGETNGKLIPNTHDCQTFYQCEYEKPALINCDDGLLFDPIILVCNWASLVTCGETPTLEPTTSTRSSITPSSPTPTPSSPQSPSSPQPSTPTPSTSIPYDPLNPDCSLGPIFFPHPTEETQYFICISGTPILMRCPQNHYWNDDVNRCESRQFTEPICTPGLIYISHPTDIHRYYICIAGTPIEMMCPNLNIWDMAINRCILAPSVVLPSPNVPTCEDGDTFFANIYDCKKFFMCIGGKPLEMACPDGSFWDHNAATCNKDSAGVCNLFEYSN